MLSAVLRSLRTTSTRRLLASCAAVVLGAGSVTAIALAASVGGPVPPPKRLAVALRDALAAPAVPGISARIEFADHLIDSGAVQGSDPLLSGASGRLWAAAGGRFRLELQSERGDAQIVSDGTTLTVYDPGLPSAYRFALPARERRAGARAESDRIPTIASIQRGLDRLVKHLSVSAAVPSDIAGEPAYTVRLAPRRGGGLLAGAELAWDAAHGVPLRAAVYAVGDESPVLELKATDISFDAVPASTFDVSPPPDVRVTDVRRHAARPGAERRARHAAPVSGLAAVGRAVSFSLSAPATLAGLPRNGVQLIDMGTRPAALVTYGHGLGGIAVLESAAGTNRPTPVPGSSRGEDQPGLSLPTVGVGGAQAQVLPTALGTLVTFARGGVRYVVAGSVRPSVAEAAARGL
jgi:outer membrane lipoprotein-sorting protein